MAEIRCMLCGKPNPPELENCQFCQAPLKSSAFAPPEEEEGMPDWLREMGAQAEEIASPQAGEPQPDWLSDLGAEAPPEVPAQPAEGLPDWLAGLQAQPEAPEITSPAEPPAAEAVPDWLTSLMGETPSEPQPVAQEPSGAAQFTAEPGEWAGADWLSNLPATPGEKLVESVPAFTLDSEEAPPTEEGSDRLLTTLPDWVSQISAKEPEQAEATEAEPELAPASLPGWLEAIRPVEAVAPTAPVEDLTGADIVTAGPLVGLRGVISADPEAVRVRKPQAFSIKLRVTDEHRARVALLEELMAVEGKPKPVPGQLAISPQYIFRLAIAIMLFLPSIWLIFSKSQVVPLPLPGSVPCVNDFYQEIQSVPSNAPVLVAFDYEAGFSGEMDMAAEAILAQLMNRSASLALISTYPAGPALAERFIAHLNSQPPRDQNPFQNYTNLGYVPGGVLGLASLASSLRQVMPYTLDGEDAWASASLSTVNSLADFNRVLVLTDDSETARAWIEQVEPLLRSKGVSLLLVTSAQADPLVRPYYESAQRQVKGIVSGIVGGAAYISTSGFSSPARSAWDAFTASLLISALIILVGGIASLASSTLVHSKKSEKQEQV